MVLFCFCQIHLLSESGNGFFNPKPEKSALATLENRNMEKVKVLNNVG